MSDENRNAPLLSHIARTLVICPTHDGITKQGEDTIAELRAAGATILRNDGTSCITTHRNLLATVAAKFLDAHRDPPFWWVLWLDGDMSAGPEQLSACIHYALQLCPSPLPGSDAETERVELVDGQVVNSSDYPDPLSLAPSVSAIYPSRARPDQIAAVRLTDRAVRPVPRFRGRDQHDLIDAIPAFSGLGFTVESTSAFFARCSKAPIVPADNGQEMLVVCQCGLKPRASGGGHRWVTEDFWYCEESWIASRGHYIVPVPVGHRIRQIAWPDLSLPLGQTPPPAEPTPKN